MPNSHPNDAGQSTDASAMIDAAISVLSLNRCDAVDEAAVIAQSDSWMLLNHLPATGWNSSEQMSPVLVGRAVYESGVLEKNTTLIASSRLPKNLQSHSAWFDAIRTIGARLDPDSQTLLTASGMTADPYVRRISALFGIELLDVDVISHQQLSKRKNIDTETDKILFLKESDANSIDVQLIKMAHTVHVLSVRNGGNIHQGIANRLGPTSAGQTHPSTIRLLNDAALTKTKTRTELLEMGAIDWLLLPTASNDDQDVKSNQSPKQMGSIVPLESIDQSQFLLHWARRQSNAWPDQDQNAHLDQLIFGSAEDRYQEVMTLCRIIASNRLIGAAHLTRDPAPVVCFTAVPVGELPDRTVFRKHLARWDFVPYGLAIRKSVLQSAGCKEVIYGDDSDWKTLSSDHRPWFQLQTSKNGKLDWTQEREWRLLGDLDLSSIGSDDAFAFVKNEFDAKRLSEICRWPIVVLKPKSEAI